MTFPGEERGDPSDEGLLAANAASRWRDADVTERVEVERAATPWSELLAGSLGHEVALIVADATRLQGVVIEAGADWCLLEAGGRALLIPLRQVVTVSGLGRAAPQVGTRAGMGWVLRRWRQMRSQLTVHLVDRSVLHGQVADVLADAFTLGVDSERESLITIPFTAVCRVAGDQLSE
ncbi:MAG: hypothetical protein ABI720_04050 [Actinomycetes bacterium]